AAAHGDRRRALSDACGPLSRARPGARQLRPPRDRRAHTGRPPAAGHPVLPDDLHAAAARAVGGDRRREVPGRERGRRAAGPRLRPPRCARGRGGRAAVTPRQRAARRQGLLYLAPALIALGLLTGYPGLWVFWLSLQRRMPVFGIERF